MKKGILWLALGVCGVITPCIVAQEAQEQTEVKTEQTSSSSTGTAQGQATKAPVPPKEEQPAESQKPADDQTAQAAPDKQAPANDADAQKDEIVAEPEQEKKEEPARPEGKKRDPAEELDKDKPEQNKEQEPAGQSDKKKPQEVEKEPDKPVKKIEKPADESDKEKPKEEKESAQPAEKEEQPSLLDTIDIEEGGNWVLKRKALQDTVRKIEDINDLYDKVRDTNIVFLQGINTVDKLFTKFSFDIGYDLGKVDQMVQDISAHMDEERDEEGDLSVAERAILQKAAEHKQEMLQLQTDTQDVWKAYMQLKEARAINDNQIIESDRMRQQAWGNFRLIERVLSEVKAEELYQETAQLYESMQRTYNYLQTKLIPHFQKSIATIQEKMKSIGAKTDELQKLGILLSQKTEAVERAEQQMQQAQELGQKEEIVKEAGLWASIKRIAWSPFAALGNLWNWITGASDTSQYLPDSEDDSND